MTTPEATPDKASAADAVALSSARVALGAATARLSLLTGLDLNAAEKREPGSASVALVILGTPPAVIETTGATRAEAMTRATAFLTRLADTIESARVRRAPAATPSTALQPLPTPSSPTGTTIVSLGVRKAR